MRGGHRDPILLKFTRQNGIKSGSLFYTPYPITQQRCPPLGTTSLGQAVCRQITRLKYQFDRDFTGCADFVLGLCMFQVAAKDLQTSIYLGLLRLVFSVPSPQQVSPLFLSSEI